MRHDFERSTLKDWGGSFVMRPGDPWFTNEHSVGLIPYSCMSWWFGEIKCKPIFLYETQMFDTIDISTQFLRFL